MIQIWVLHAFCNLFISKFTFSKESSMKTIKVSSSFNQDHIIGPDLFALVISKQHWHAES